MTEIAIEPHVDSITMPENLRVGLMISEHRKKCSAIACSFDYYGFAFGQSPFQVPLPIQKALVSCQVYNVARFKSYYPHIRSEGIQYEEIYCDTFQRRT